MTRQLYQARPTVYRGVQMRSRLEAQAAESFDRHDVEWCYEPKAFGSPSGQYLPDFLVWPGDPWQSFVEMKGVESLGHLGPVMARMEIIYESEPSAHLFLDARGPSGSLRLHGWLDPGCARGHWVPSVDQGLDVGALFCKGCERCSEDV